LGVAASLSRVAVLALASIALASIARPQLGHEVPIEHCLPHLGVLLGLCQLVVLTAT